MRPVSFVFNGEFPMGTVVPILSMPRTMRTLNQPQGENHGN